MMLHALLFRLAAAHVFADYVFQSEFMGKAKQPDSTFVRDKYGPWWWWMTAHAFLNGFFVYWATYSVTAGYAEMVVHGVTDYAKCKGWVTTIQDQWVHIGSKLLWAWLTWEGVW